MCEFWLHGQVSRAPRSEAALTDGQNEVNDRFSQTPDAFAVWGMKSEPKFFSQFLLHLLPKCVSVIGVPSFSWH